MNLDNQHIIFSRVSKLLAEARKQVFHTVNTTMLVTYFEIGKIIVEEEQSGNERADYGKFILKELSKKLTKDFGKGFSLTNLKHMRQFYTTYSISQTPSDQFKLSWSHYLKLMRIEEEKERRFYEIEASKNNWSVRELNRQYNSALYTRLVLSRNKEKIKELSEKVLILAEPADIIKDPYILEFIRKIQLFRK